MYKNQDALVIDKEPSPLDPGKFEVRPEGASLHGRHYFFVDADGEQCDDPGINLGWANMEGRSWNLATTPTPEWKRVIVEAGTQCCLCSEKIENDPQCCIECKIWLHEHCSFRCHCDVDLCLSCGQTHQCADQDFDVFDETVKALSKQNKIEQEKDSSVAASS